MCLGRIITYLLRVHIPRIRICHIYLTMGMHLLAARIVTLDWVLVFLFTVYYSMPPKPAAAKKAPNEAKRLRRSSRQKSAAAATSTPATLAVAPSAPATAEFIFAAETALGPRLWSRGGATVTVKIRHLHPF